MSKILKVSLIVVGVLAVFGALVFGIIWMTAGPRDAATNFFQLLKIDKIDEAYDITSEVYKKQNDIGSFTNSVKNNDWKELKKTFWNNTNVTGGSSAVISGTITMTDGSVIPASLQLVKEKGEWKISKIESAVFNQKKMLKIPADAENNKLISDTLSIVVDAIKKKNFTGFYQSISQLWQVKTTAVELQKAFQFFANVDNKDESYLLETITVAPVLSAPPSIDENDFLVLSGYYPNNKGNLYFNLRYLYEYPAWKLISIDLNIK